MFRAVTGDGVYNPASLLPGPSYLPPMRIGLPREIKDGERRIGIVPDGVRALVQRGHAVVVETGAGCGSGFADVEFVDAGATVASGPDEIWSCALVVKVKEIQRAEYPRLQAGTTVFGFAQINRDPALLGAVLASRVRIIAYETVRGADGSLPLLAPMSRIAGRLAPLVGAQALQTPSGGNGTLLTGIDDVPAARVLRRCERSGSLACATQPVTRVRLDGSCILCVIVGGVRVKVVRRDHLRDLIRVEPRLALEEAGCRKMPSLAITARKRLVGDTLDERLQEAVLAPFGRARVGLEREQLLPHQGGEDRLEVGLGASRYRREPALGERLAEHGCVLE